MLLYEGVDVFESAAAALLSNPECIVTRRTIEELKALASSKSARRRRAALTALKEVERRGCKIVDVEGATADDTVIAYVVKDPCAVVATADRELRRRIRELGLPHLFYKHDRRSLVLEGA
jgi:rRNA-processing protein FCF1